MLKWTPVSPDLKSDGSFLALSHLDNASEMKPIELDADAAAFSHFKVHQNQLSMEIAAKLGVAPIGNVDTSFRSTTFMYEAMLYSDKLTEMAVGGKIWGTRWGAGVRVALKVSQTQANVNVSFGAIAASSELGIVDVEFEITGIGITDPAILNVLPGPGTFDYKTYQRILEAADKVKAYMGANTTKLKPMPFQLLLQETKLTDPFSQSHSVLFAVHSIVKRKSLEEAFQDAANQFNTDMVKYVYQKFGIVSMDQVPTKEDKNEARDWLNQTN